ncbi:hypothetical protein [Cetobacterium ceti]
MNICKSGDPIEYKVPIFTCTKCNQSEVFSPMRIAQEAVTGNIQEIILIPFCSNCGNNEFTMQEAITINGGKNLIFTK